LDGGSACPKAVTYTQNNTNIEQTHIDIYALSGIRTQDPSVRVSDALDRAVTVIGTFHYRLQQKMEKSLIKLVGIRRLTLSMTERLRNNKK
jgi:hypothetical protein